MFDEHFHQFIAAASSRTTTTTTPPTSIPFHGPNSNTYTTGFTSFDPNSYSSTTTTTTNTTNTTNTQLHSNFLHHPQQQEAPTQKNIIEAGDTNKQQQQVNRKGENLVEIQSSVVLDHDNDDTSWSSDEVLALLRIRSTLEINNWFPEYTWEHVSRKLLQLGFKRSADRCKEKFEEESSTYFNTNNNNNYIKVNFTELDEAAIFEQQPQEININTIQVQKNKPIQQEHVQDKMVEQDSTNINQNPCDEVNINSDDDDDDKRKKSNFYKKRKIREKKFEMFKSFCEDIVHKMMAQQEEMHSKIIEDLVKRDQEKLAREEEWKMKEMERFNKEIEIRAQEQLVACNRQSAIIKFLKSFANSDDDHLLTCLDNNNGEKSQPLGTNSSSCNSFENCQTNKNVENLVKVSSPISSPLVSNPNHAGNNIVEKSSSSSSMNPTRQPISSIHHENPKSSALALVPPSQNPNSNNTLLLEKPTQRNPNLSDDIGKRWPRDEVLGLINIRSNLYHINGEDKEGGGGGATTTSKAPPLWERISQGMLELGYKRSAKRCKEKWENINKYFRKTKDVNKKRSLDSRTCPYFHQLSTLYNQGTLPLPENHSPMPESGGGDKLVVADQGEKQSNNGQSQGFEFEF